MPAMVHRRKAGSATTDGRDGLAHFLRIVDQIRPMAFLMENVPGLAAPGNLEYLRALMARPD